jgi:hypothetical protein
MFMSTFRKYGNTAPTHQEKHHLWSNNFVSFCPSVLHFIPSTQFCWLLSTPKPSRTICYCRVTTVTRRVLLIACSVVLETRLSNIIYFPSAI